MVAAGILSPGEDREAVDWTVLLAIGAALGLGQAMEASGAAQMIGEDTVDAIRPLGPYGLLAGLILVTALLTNIVTNNGPSPSCFRLPSPSPKVSRSIPGPS
jgi:di/tricarboxylate transporter